MQGEAVEHLGEEKQRLAPPGQSRINAMNELLVTLQLPKETAETCIKAIGLEVENDVHERSKVDLKYGNGILVLVIKSKDLTSMRAALNTYLRWIIMCSNLIGKEKQ